MQLWLALSHLQIYPSAMSTQLPFIGSRSLCRCEENLPNRTWQNNGVACPLTGRKHHGIKRIVNTSFQDFPPTVTEAALKRILVHGKLHLVRAIRHTGLQTCVLNIVLDKTAAFSVPNVAVSGQR